MVFNGSWYPPPFCYRTNTVGPSPHFAWSSRLRWSLVTGHLDFRPSAPGGKGCGMAPGCLRWQDLMFWFLPFLAENLKRRFGHGFPVPETLMSIKCCHVYAYLKHLTLPVGFSANQSHFQPRGKFDEVARQMLPKDGQKSQKMQVYTLQTGKCVCVPGGVSMVHSRIQS